MTFDKLEEIADNYINGNISDARKAVKHMSKSDMLCFIDVLSGYFNEHDCNTYQKALHITAKLVN